jgi:hypothetical protein
MKDFLGVAARVSPKMLKKMRLCVGPKQAAGKYLVVIVSARADTFLCDQIRYVAFPRQLKSSAGVRGFNWRCASRQFLQFGKLRMGVNYANRIDNRSPTSREASAAGRLRPNAEIVQVAHSTDADGKATIRA